jgi:cytochrome c oxidase subunit 2
MPGGGVGRAGFGTLRWPIAAVALVLSACGGSGPSLSEAAQRGRVVAARAGCAACHSADGAAGVGPTWRGSWGTTVRLADGSVTVVDGPYVERAVRNPGAERREGSWPPMPAYSTSLISDQQLADLVAYLRELS